MCRILRYRRVWLLLLFPACFLLSSLAAFFPGVVERFYAHGVYPLLAGVFGRISAVFPFSLAEFLLVSAVLGALPYMAVQLAGIARRPGERADRSLRLLLNLLCAAAVVYGWFVLACGLNYQRQTFADDAGLKIQPSSVEELKSLCYELVDAVNLSRGKLPEDEYGVCAPVYGNPYQAARQAAAAFSGISTEYPALGGYTPPPKPVLFSRGMSYLNITGVYFPFTFESNVNADVPHFSLPATMMHELAHFKGFMREQEANYIAYLACIHSGDSLFAYSGNSLALTYSANALYAADRDAYFQVMDGLSEGARRDLRASSDYWQRFETPVATAAAAMNDTYLRANWQESGVKSYGEMVDLLLAARRAAESL
jgi:hypothetical protein